MLSTFFGLQGRQGQLREPGTLLGLFHFLLSFPELGKIEGCNLLGFFRLGPMV
jgi:hypothetical protein